MLLVCLIVAGFVFLERIAAWAAIEVLAVRFGLPSHIEINRIGSNQAQIGSFSLGSRGEVQVSDIALQFQPTAMVLNRIEIGHLEIHARYDGHAISLGELDPMLRQLMKPAASSGGGTLGPLPSIILHRIDVSIETPVGVLSGTGMATIDQGVVYSQFTMEESNKKSAIHLDLNAALNNQSPPQGNIAVDLSANSALWQIFGLPQPTAGSFHLTAQLKQPVADTTGSGNRIATGALVMAADWTLSGDGLTWPSVPAPLGLQGNGRAVLSERRMDLPNFDIKANGGWSPDATAHAQGSGTLDRTSETTTVQINTDLSGQAKAAAIGTLQARNPALDLGLHIALSDQGLVIQPNRDGTIKAAQMAVGTAVKSVNPLAVTLKKTDASQVTLSLDPAADNFLQGVLALSVPKADIITAGMNAPAHLAIPGATLTFSYGASTGLQYGLDLKNGEAAMTAPDVAAHKVAIALKGQGGKLSATLGAGTLAGPSGTISGALDGKANLDGTKLDFSSKLTATGNKATLTAKGNYNLTSGAGKVDLEIPALTFAPGGLQPRDLVPSLATMTQDVAGTMALKGPIILDKNGITSQVELNLQDLTGKFGPIALRNLNSVIEIDRPWPLTTAADQVVSVELADVGLPLTNGVVHFKVDNGADLALADSHLEMMGGHVTLDPVTLHLGAPAQQIRLNVDRISLVNLFQLFSVSGLTGEGNLSGTIPVTLFPAGLAIDHAKLEAQEPGKLSYDASKGPAALSNTADSVKMALSALSDFRYDKLSIDLNRAATGDTDLGLHVSGRNPSFYNGYPVEFNLSVTGRLDEALRKGLAGYQVPDMIRERLKQYNQ
ncbi:MAG TPA: YdbH domain-containing protein [Dongiaceae bacterium]